MKISARDFVIVRRGLVVLAILAGLGAGAIAVALDRAQRANEHHRQAVAERGALQARLARADDETARLRGETARYRDLLVRGIVGAERRLDWAETVDRIGEELHLPELRYEFSPQRRLDPDARPGGAAFMASTMTLRLLLLHEEDLLGLLERLAEDAAALLRVRNCRVERLAGGDAAGALARLRAECAIDWITLQHKA